MAGILGLDEAQKQALGNMIRQADPGFLLNSIRTHVGRGKLYRLGKNPVKGEVHLCHVAH